MTMVNVGLGEAARAAVVKLLNDVLADEFVLYTKTRKFHWNVTGPHFHDLHKFFEAQYDALAEVIDEVAERARFLGGLAIGTLGEFQQHARLKEEPGQNPAARAMVAALLADHEALIRALRGDLDRCANEYQDMGTNDFLTGLMETHEKMAWMLRSLTEGTWAA